MPRRTNNPKRRVGEIRHFKQLVRIAKLTPYQRVMVHRYLIYKLKRYAKDKK